MVLSALVLAGSAAYLWLHGQRTATGLTLYGDVDIREMQPAFNASGPITRLLVQEGAAVKHGQLLATLDDTRAAAVLAQARAQMRSEHQVLAKLLAGSRPEEIAQAKASMVALRVIAENDAVTYRRLATLTATGAATIQIRDDARAAVEAAHQQYEAARQAYILAVKGPRVEDIAAARAAWQASVAAVALAQRQFDDTRLLASADGVVENRILEVGDMASPATPVFTIALPSPMWVRAYVPESDLGKISLGMRATVTTDSFPGHLYKGWVGYVSPVAEFTPKAVETPALRTALVYQLRVFVCDTKGGLRLGMPATVLLAAPAAGAAPSPGCGPDDGIRH